MSNLETALNGLKGKVIEEIVGEFKGLLSDGRKSSVAFIEESAKNATRWLEMFASGDLTRSEIEYLLKRQKRVAEIYANTQAIVVKAKVQKLTYRTLDIAIDILLGVIVPV